MRSSHRELSFESLDSRLCFAFGDVDTSFGVDGELEFSYQSDAKTFEFMRGLFEHQGFIRTLAVYDYFKYGMSSVDTAGNLQSSYGENGTVRINNRLLQNGFNPSYLLSDGKILALETSRNPLEPFVVELLPDGTPNPDFGDQGVVKFNTLNFGDATMFPLPSGGFLVIQSAFFNDSSRVTKYTSLGQLDASFGQGGVSQILGLSQITKPYVDEQNRILLAGTRYDPIQQVSKFTLFRLLPNGSIDTTLGGSQGLPIDPSVFEGWLVATHPNEVQYTTAKLDTSSSTPPTSVRFQRVLGDGSSDGSFGANGVASIPIPQQWNMGSLTANLLMVDELGQAYLVLLGRYFSNTSNILICRIKSDGTLDESYGQNGWFYRTVQGALQLHRGLLLSSGGLVLGGEDFISYNQFLVKITPSGMIDLNFSQDGQATLDLHAATRSIKRLNTIKQPDQELGILSGWYPEQGTLGRGVRLNSQGQQLTEFAFQVSNGQSTVVTNPQGGWYEIYYNSNPNTGDGLQIIKRLSDGSTDITFGQSGGIKLTQPVVEYSANVGGAIGRDGSLYVFVATGSSTLVEGKKTALLAKISASGQLDVSYGQQGVVLFDDPNHRFVSIATNRSGEVYLVTSAMSQQEGFGYQVVALDNLGRLKTSFGNSGTVVTSTPYSPAIGGIAIDETGRLFIVAVSNGRSAVFALNANGQRNISFGSGGQVILPIEDLRTYSSLRIVVQRGVVAVWGTQSGLRSSSARLVALNYAGVLDNRLNGTGYRDYNLGSSFATNNDIFFADDGSLYASVFRDVEADSIGTVLKLEGTGDVLIHNWKSPMDVNKSKLVTPSDALVIINYLNNRQGNTIPGLYDGINFPDVNDDLQVTPSDALAIIDHLNKRSPT